MHTGVEAKEMAAVVMKIEINSQHSQIEIESQHILNMFTGGTKSGQQMEKQSCLLT